MDNWPLINGKPLWLQAGCNELILTLKKRIMKNYIALVLFVCLTNVGMAQAFQRDGNYLQAGIGAQLHTLGPISVGYERGITGLIGIGRFGVGGVIANEFYYNPLYVNSVQNRTTLMGRCAYHFDFDIEKMDVYAGAAVAIQFRGDNKDKNTGYNYGNNIARISPFPTVFGGIRYYFSEKFAVYAEVGYGLGYLSGGIVYRFNYQYLLKRSGLNEF